MTDFRTAINVISNNSGDIQEIIQKVGGIGPFLKMVPNLLRIVATVADSKKTPEEIQTAVEEIKSVLYYSDETKERVKKFQEKHGLVVDGLVGDRTWSKVESLLK